MQNSRIFEDIFSELKVHLMDISYIFSLFYCIWTLTLLCRKSVIAKIHALFWVKMFWLKFGLCKKNLIFQLCVIVGPTHRTLFILRTERTPCRVPLVWQGILRSPHCFTLLSHLTRLERQRTKAVDSLESPVTQAIVCRGSSQK